MEWQLKANNKVFGSLHRKIKRLSFRSSHQQALLEDLAALIDDGVPAKKAIEIISNTAENIIKEVAEDILVKISEGKYLVDGMYGWFPSYIIEIIRAGEEGGSLAETLKIAADALAKKNSAVATLIASLSYPLTVLVAGIIVAIYINHSIFNNFRLMLPMDQWPLVGRNVAEFASFFQTWWWLIVLVTISFIIGFAYLLINFVGEGRQLIDVLPVIKLYRKLVSARFMQILGLLIANGVVFKKALKIMQYNASPYLAWHLLAMEYQLGSGKENIAEVINTGLIEHHDLMRLKIIAHGKGFEHALIRQGNRTLNQAEKDIERTARIVGYVMLIFGAGLAIFLIYGIYDTGSALGKFA